MASNPVHAVMRSGEVRADLYSPADGQWAGIFDWLQSYEKAHGRVRYFVRMPVTYTPKENDEDRPAD